jgi:hypothetical protein
MPRLYASGCTRSAVRIDRACLGVLWVSAVEDSLTPILPPALAASDELERSSGWSIAAVIGSSQTSANEDEPQEPTL